MGLCFWSHICKVVLVLLIFTRLPRQLSKDIDNKIESLSENVCYLYCIGSEDSFPSFYELGLKAKLCTMTCTLKK